jgi:hypothetical protein
MSDIIASPVVDQVKLREILSEAGLPRKVDARLYPVELKIHAILCATYSFKTGIVEIEIPNHVLAKCGAEFNKIWVVLRTARGTTGKTLVTYHLSAAATKTTLKTAMIKDKGIFDAKINKVSLHKSWAKYINQKEEVKRNIDWSEAEREARRAHEHNKQQVMDGKTFNAHKDNPWARKNLKNKNQ